MHPIAAGIQLAPHRLRVVPRLRQDIGRSLEHGDGLAGRGGKHRGQSGGESVCGCRNALVFDNLVRAGAEASARTERAGKGAHDHVNVGWIDVLVLGDTATGSAKDTKGPGLVQDEAKFVPELKLNLPGRNISKEKTSHRGWACVSPYNLWQIDHISHFLEHPLRDDEPPRQRFL